MKTERTNQVGPRNTIGAEKPKKPKKPRTPKARKKTTPGRKSPETGGGATNAVYGDVTGGVIFQSTGDVYLDDFNVTMVNGKVLHPDPPKSEKPKRRLSSFFERAKEAWSPSAWTTKRDRNRDL